MRACVRACVCNHQINPIVFTCFRSANLDKAHTFISVERGSNVTLQPFRMRAKDMTISWKGPHKKDLPANRGAEQTTLVSVTEKLTGSYFFTGAFHAIEEIDDIWKVSGSITLSEKSCVLFGQVEF